MGFSLIFCFAYFVTVFSPVFPLKFDFSPTPKSQDIQDGRRAVLKCGVIGTQAKYYKISWMLNGKNVPNTKRRYQKENDLHFNPVDKDLDEGEFQCLASPIETSSDLIENITSEVEFNIKWVHAGGVELKSPAETSQIIPGVQVVLNCNITGNPRPRDIRWYFNGKNLSNSDSIQIKNRRLVIKSVQLATLDGAYNCCARHQPLGKRCTPMGGEFNLRVIDRRIPVLVHAPQSQIVARGSNVQLHCVYDADPPPRIWWTKDENSNKRLTNNSKSGVCQRRCIYPNGTLVLRNFRKSLEGSYTCKAEQSGSNNLVPSVSANIQMANIEPFDESSVERESTKGANFEYTCVKPKALPEASITWYRDGQEIRDGVPHISRVGQSLVINIVQADDGGVYTCVAENIAGTVKKNLTIVLASEPIFSLLSPQTVNEGTNVTWTCPVQGLRIPKVTWYKDDNKMSDIPGKVTMHELTMRIMNVGVQGKGVYYCAVESRVGQSGQSNKAELWIRETLKFSPTLHGMCFEAGKEATVMCRVRGSLKSPQIRWTKVNSSRDLEQKSSYMMQSLTLPNADIRDSGRYRCSAVASPSDNISAMIRIDVVPRPVIRIPPENKTVFERRQVTLHCATTPEEKAKVAWCFKGKLLNATLDQNYAVFANGSLVIFDTDFDNSGIYECSYTNCGFATKAVAELNVAAEPPSASMETPTDVNPTQLIQTIALSVSGGIAYILFTVALIIYCRGKHKSSKKDRTSQDEEERMLNGSSCNGHARGNHDDELVEVANGVPMKDLSHLNPVIDNLLYPVTNIEPVTVVGKGDFGDVFLSKAPGLFPNLEEDILVMVKAFHPEIETDDSSLDNGHVSVVSDLRSEFNREINLLHEASHENVVKLLAVCSKQLKPDHLVTEYLEWGILKLCLEASKEKKMAKFNKTHKMNMCCQLACGLEHLNKLGLVHKDVATRNCVVSSHLLVKISLLGLSKEGFETEYHLYKGRRLPIRWMPPEALFEGRYSSKSDVWSFAISCWEIFTLGEAPYENLSNEDYLNAFRKEDPPKLPSLDGSKRITSLINKCCHPDPEERPDIRQITRKLQSIIGSGDAPDDAVKTKAIVTTETSDILTEDPDEG